MNIRVFFVYLMSWHYGILSKMEKNIAILYISFLFVFIFI